MASRDPGTQTHGVGLWPHPFRQVKGAQGTRDLTPVLRALTGRPLRWSRAQAAGNLSYLAGVPSLDPGTELQCALTLEGSMGCCVASVMETLEGG